MVKTCKNHNWKAIYYRKKEKLETSQKWVKVEGFRICDCCLKIVKEEVKEVGRN